MSETLAPVQDEGRRHADDRPAGDRIRVLELVASGTDGGAQEHVTALLAGLDRRRFDLRVVSLGGGRSVDRWRSTGVPVDVLDGDDDMRLVAVLARRLDEHAIQVSHGHMYRAEVVGTRAALRLHELGRPRPYVINHIHSSRRRDDADRALLDALDPSMDRLIAVSRAIEAKLAQERPNRPPVELIYNGVDLGRFDPRRLPQRGRSGLGLPEGAPLVGCVARLEPEKGLDVLLRAWGRVIEAVPQARLLVVGGGSQLRALVGLARALGLSARPSRRRGRLPDAPDASVIFAGPREDIPALTACLDVAVLPSRREAQGLVVLEAMAMARPVVASRVGGIPEMIEDGVTGLLVRPGDSAALADAIVRLLRDRDAARRIGRAGQALVRASFAIERMLADVAALYEEGAAVWTRRAWQLHAAGVVARVVDAEPPRRLEAGVPWEARSA